MFREVSEGEETHVRGHMAGSQGRLQNVKAARTMGYRVESEKGKSQSFHTAVHTVKQQ